MIIQMQTTRVLPKISELQAFRFKRFEYHKIPITKKPELIISINKRNYFLEYQDSSDGYLIRELDSGNKPLILSNDGFIQLGDIEEDSCSIMLMKYEDAIVVCGNSSDKGNLIIHGKNISDFVLERVKNKKGDNYLHRPEIGSLYDPKTGHVINGGSNFYSGENGINSPIVVVDFENDVELKRVFERVKDKLKIKSGSAKLLSEESILEEIFLEFNKIEYLSDDKIKKLAKVKRGLNLGPVLFRYGQVCRLNAYGVSAITEEAIKKGYLGGKIFYAGQYDHGFPLYKSQSGSFYVMDATQDKFDNLTTNPEAKHRGCELIDGKEVYNYYRYQSALRDEMNY